MDNEQIQDTIKYETLIPTDTVENKAEDALEFAFNNEKINNVAITGPYSSGKSSIIKSYLNNKNIDKKEYLNISLATFDTSNQNITNSLEKVIIEKLYFSILNKYENNRNIISCIITGFIVAFINICIFIFNKETIINSFKNDSIISHIFMALEISCLTAAIYYAISYALNLQRIKFKVGDIELEVKQENDSSLNLLNQELEFIIKTMNIAKYKYVIFEDLDRFEDPKIFERLRDLNVTLNTTLKQKVKFIYAIRDEMFIADNRTKFFDFIFPVVPYVSYENSGEQLYKLIKEYELDKELSEDFVLDICLFISDMRILKNTLNEYIIYKKTLDKKLPSYENLFAILLYKNTCSKDFANLQKKEGILYGIFLTKNKEIDIAIAEKKKELEEENKKYREVEKSLTDIKSIKELFIYKIKSSISNTHTITLKEDGEDITTISYGMDVDDIPDDKIFSDNLIIEYYHNGWKNESLYDFFNSKCPDFEKEYTKYKNIVEGAKEKIIENIEKINKQIERINESTLVELLENNSDILIDFEQYSDLMRYLLSNGYINENYLTYINKFHEGSITENDYIYITSVKNNKDQNYDNKIDNPLKIIKRLKEKDFKKDQVLNIYILDTLVDNKEYEQKKNIFLETLIYSNRYIFFLENALCSNDGINNKNQILQELCKKDNNIWLKIKESSIIEESKKTLIEEIVVNVDIEIINRIKQKEDMIRYIECNNLLRNRNINEIEKVLKELNIKYCNIQQFINNLELYKYIIDNNHYEINYENIEQILSSNTNITKLDIKEKNYEKILKNDKLKKYINEDIQLYFKNVYDKLEEKQKNSSELVIELLNNENINLERKEKILSKETEKIDDISKIENQKLYKIVFNNDLIKIDWNNINKYYNIFGLDDVIINLLNNKENASILLYEDIELEDKISQELLQDLLLNNDLNEEVYSLILQNSTCKIRNADISNLNTDKVLILVNNRRIEFNMQMFNNIRNYSYPMLIEFIRNNYTSVYSEINKGNIKFLNSEIDEIVKSTLSIKIKEISIKMIETNEDDEIEISLELSKNIINLLLDNKLENIIDIRLLEKLLMDTRDIMKKIKLLNLNFGIVNIDNISLLLPKLGKRYYDIIIDRKKPRFQNNNDILLLIENIRTLGYNIKYELKDEEIRLTNTKRM